MVTQESFPNFVPAKGPSDFGNENIKSQSVNYQVFRRAPVARELGEGQMVLAIIAGVKRLYTKIDGAVVSVVLT